MPIPNVSPDTERHLLGGLIRDGIPFPADLIPSDFGEPKHQEMASALVSLREQSVTPDELTVSAKLREMKATAAEHDVNAATASVGFTPYNAAWAAEVRRLSVLRHIEATAKRVAQIAADPAADPEAVLAYQEGQMKAVDGRAKKQKAEGAELMDLATLDSFDRKADPASVIGNRWLTKSGSMLLVSQSGVGKSSFALQMLISFAVGRAFFGIKAKRPLRIVMLQAENDLGDVAEAFQDITAGMSLYPDELRNLSENLAIYRDTHSVGKDFLARMRELVVRHNADIFLCDPLLSFCGIEVADQQQMTDFLRHGINPILFDTGVIGIFVHHTTKPRAAKDKEGQTPADLAYAGSGASEFTNWARECAVLQRCPGDEPVFKFALTKRRGRAGMQDEAGEFKSEITVRHARQQGVIRWEYAPSVLPASEAASQKAHSSPSKGSPRGFESK